MEAIFWGAILRMLQSAAQGAPFIFTGLCVAALFHRLMGHEQTRRLFGSNSIVSLFQSWLIGMLLPGCSLGVIPICKQLRATGIAVGTIFAFALSSPLFDPLSLLYGLTLSKPFTIVAFAACSLVVVTVSGSLFDWMFPKATPVSPEPLPTPPGVRRLLAVLVVMARESVSDSAVMIGCGLLGSGLLSCALPPSSLQRTMAHDNPWSPVMMTAIAIPAYATPMTAMGQLGSMFQHGNSIGAAFVLLALGAGMNVGLLVWMVVNYGWKKSVVWMALMVIAVLGLSYGVERPLYPRDIEAADHTHAFDSYCQPYSPEFRPQNGYAADIVHRLRRDTQPHEFAGVAILSVLIVCGLGLKLLDRRWKIESWLNSPPAAATPEKPVVWDVNVPGPVLAGVGLLAIVAMSIVGCFAYYPDPRETLEEMKLAKVEALSAARTGNREHALHWIPIWADWNRRLQVGTFIRTGRLSEYHRMKSRVMEHKLEHLEHMVENNDPPDEIGRYVSETDRAFVRLAAAYRSEL